MMQSATTRLIEIAAVGVLLAVVVTVGCSNRQVYDSALASTRIQCSKLPEWQYRDCMEEASKPYHDYQRERAEAQEM